MKAHGSKLENVSTSTGSLQTTVDELVSELFNLLGRGEVPCFKLNSFEIKMPKCFGKLDSCDCLDVSLFTYSTNR